MTKRDAASLEKRLQDADASWKCVLKHCSASARRELLQDAMEGRWVRNIFLFHDVEKIRRLLQDRPNPHKPLDLEPTDARQVYLDPEMLSDDVLIRVWVTMSRSPTVVQALRAINVVGAYRAFFGSGLSHSQYEDVAEQAAAKNLAADHALIEFRKPAANGQPAKSWSIGFAGDPTLWQSKEGSVRSYDWWFNEKIWKATERIKASEREKNKKATTDNELFAVLIGMGKMTSTHAAKLQKLLTTAKSIRIEEFKSNTDYRIYLTYPPDSKLSRFSTIVRQSRAKDLLNCIAFAALMFPEIIQCPSSNLGYMMPGLCHAVTQHNLRGPWCMGTSECLAATDLTESSDEPRQKKRRL